MNSIDIAKFVGSVLIFAMHCKALGDYKYASIALEIIARWGVPFFFISSSFFLFRKSVGGNVEKKHLQRYIFRIAMLYLCWIVFNLPSIYIIRLLKTDLTDLNTWLTFIKNSILSSTFTGSWYLVSCIFSAYLIYLLSKRFQTKTLLKITSAFYILCVFTSVYKGILPPQISNILIFLCFPLNIFTGCFYFSVGKYISENEQLLVKVFTKTKSLLLFLIFYLIYVMELIVAKHFEVFGSTDVAFSTVALSCTLFLFCIQIKINIKNSTLIRKLSIIIYCCQSNVLIFNGLCKKILGGYSIIAFIASTLVVTAISIAVLIIQRKSQWKFTDYLT